jgi:hypothetical protein
MTDYDATPLVCLTGIFSCLFVLYVIGGLTVALFGAAVTFTYITGSAFIAWLKR